MRARKLAGDIVGKQGNVLGQKLSAEELEKRLSQAGVPDTKKFLEKVVKDSQG